MKVCSTYANVILQLNQWYSSKEKKARFLTACHNMTLSKNMFASPSLSEVAGVHVFAAKLMSLQTQLDSPHKSYYFLRDRFMTAPTSPRFKQRSATAYPEQDNRL